MYTFTAAVLAAYQFGAVSFPAAVLLVGAANPAVSLLAAVTTAKTLAWMAAWALKPVGTNNNPPAGGDTCPPPPTLASSPLALATGALAAGRPPPS